MQNPRGALAHLTVAVMTADGRISPSEIAAVSRLEHLGLGSLVTEVQREMESVVQGTALDVAGACKALGRLRHEWAATILAKLAGIAASDRDVSMPEVEMLTAIGLGFGLSDAVTQEVLRLASAGEVGEPPAPASNGHSSAGTSLRGTSPTPIARATRSLGVEPGASIDELNARYFDLIRILDPAKMIDLGPEFVVLAVQRLSDITAAYQALTSRKTC